MKLEYLIGRTVIRTQAIRIGNFMDTSYMHHPIYVEKYDEYKKKAVVTDFDNGYGAILGIEWLDDNWQPAGDLSQYKDTEYDKLSHIIKAGENPETLQSVMNRSKTITTKNGDPEIFDKVKGVAGKLSEESNNDIDNKIIESLKSKVDDIVNGKERIETSKYNSKDIIDLSITTKYSVPTVKDLKDYYFDNYQVKVIYSDNKEEMFEGKNILSGTVLDFD